MTTREQFFPFDPRATRQSFVVGALACALVTAWAIAAALEEAERFAAVRAVASALLMAAFVYGQLRLRPRAGWGVTVSAAGLSLARPFTGNPIEIDWHQLQRARRERRGGGILVLDLKRGGHVQIGRHLFSNLKEFNALADAISERAPQQRLDA